MKDTRYIRFISLILAVTIILSIVPLRDVRADSVEASSGILNVVYNEISKREDLTHAQVEIRNDSEEIVHGWNVDLAFERPVVVASVWDAEIDDTDISSKSLKFCNKDNNADINPHESVTFGLITRSNNDKLPSVSVSQGETEGFVKSGLFPYAMFADNKFTFSGWKSNVIGSVYAGSSFNYMGSEFEIFGLIDSAGESNTNGCSIGTGRINNGVQPLEMPDYSEGIRNKQELFAPLDINSLSSASEITGNGFAYIDGDVVISGSKFDGDCVIIASGNITYNVDSISGDGRVLLFSENGNIWLNGTQIVVNGILYAPNGNVAINAYDTTLNGRVIAKNIDYSGSILNVSANTEDLNLMYTLPNVQVVASAVTANLNDEVYFEVISETVETPYEVLYRINGSEAFLDENNRYYLDTTTIGDQTFDAYVVLGDTEIVLDSKTISILEPVPTDVPTNTPEPTAEVTEEPEVSPITEITPTATDTPTATPTEEPTVTPTNTPVPTSTPTSKPTNTPTPTVKPTNTSTPTPTVKPTSTAVPTVSVTPTPVIPQDQLPLEEQERYFVYSQGNPQYNYDELFDPDKWTDVVSSSVNPKVIDLVKREIITTATVKSNFTCEFCPDYSFNMRFTFSNDVNPGNAFTVGLMNGSGNSVEIQIDYTMSEGDHYWKNELGQGEWENAQREPYDSMVGINLNGDGMRDYALNQYKPLAAAGSVHDVWFEYDGQTETFYVYMATYRDGEIPEKPEDPTLTCHMSMADIMGEDHELHFFANAKVGLFDDNVNYSIHGLELDPYPQIHGERSSIELLKPANDERIEIGTPIVISGRVADDIVVAEAYVNVENSDGKTIYDEPITISGDYEEIVSIDTADFQEDTYKVTITVIDDNGNTYTKVKNVTVESEIISIDINRAVLYRDYIYIDGQIFAKGTHTIKREFFDYRKGSWRDMSGRNSKTLNYFHTDGTVEKIPYIGYQRESDNPFDLIWVKITVTTED